jgi:hypothetical protein
MVKPGTSTLPASGPASGSGRSVPHSRSANPRKYAPGSFQRLRPLGPGRRSDRACSDDSERPLIRTIISHCTGDADRIIRSLGGLTRRRVPPREPAAVSGRLTGYEELVPNPARDAICCSSACGSATAAACSRGVGRGAPNISKLSSDTTQVIGEADQRARNEVLVTGCRTR